MGEARGGGGGEEEVLADTGADALLLAPAERPAVEGDDAVGEAAVREPVVQPHPATRDGEGREESSLVSHNSRAWKGRADGAAALCHLLEGKESRGAERTRLGSVGRRRWRLTAPGPALRRRRPWRRRRRP